MHMHMQALGTHRGSQDLEIRSGRDLRRFVVPCPKRSRNRRAPGRVSKAQPPLSKCKSNPKPGGPYDYLVSPDCVLYVIIDTDPNGPDVQQLRQLRNDVPP